MHFQQLSHGALRPAQGRVPLPPPHRQPCWAWLFLKHSGGFKSKQQLGLTGTSRDGKHSTLQCRHRPKGIQGTADDRGPRICMIHPNLSSAPGWRFLNRDTAYGVSRLQATRPHIREALHCASMFCWEQRIGRYFCGSTEFQILFVVN